MDGSQRLSLVPCSHPPAHISLPCKSLQLHPRPPKPQPCCQPSQQQHTSAPPSSLALSHSESFAILTARKNSQSQTCTACSHGTGASTAEWELKVLGARGRTGGVGGKVSLNGEGHCIRQSHKLPRREPRSSGGEGQLRLAGPTGLRKS